ncbi:MAG: hypothetical protein ACJ75R_02170 [Solirubrobacterales bacterium]
MRDLVVEEGLRTMAGEASDRLRELVASGEEIPYEVIEPGNGSALCRYEPRTEAFVRDHAPHLSELDSFGSACAALEAAELAATYLEDMGVGVPDDPRRRAELAGVVFLCRLWMNSSDFSLEADRLDAAIDELQAGADVGIGEIEVIVPVRGLQMPVPRLDLATATILRSDTVEAPAEAQAGEAVGASPWEPAFLAVARVPDPDADPEADSDAAVVDAFRTLVTTLRLFKSGGVGLGPHAWTKVSGDRWRRIATGAGRARPGGYRLAESDLGPLQSFSNALAEGPFARRAGRPGLPRALTRSLSRFESGLERNVVIEALNDYLLALRFVLEGGGPAELGLAMRISALCAEPERRAEVKAVVDRAIGLERELWSGEPAPGSATPAETAAELEELTRAILKDAACGHLGSDLRSTADEILLADGLAVGEGSVEQRGATAEWEFGEETELIDELSELDAAMEGSSNPQRSNEPEAEPEPEPEPEPELDFEFVRRTDHGHDDDEQMSLSPQPIEPEPAPPEANLDEHSPVLRLIEQTRAERRAHHERVAGLFPRPETTEWNVREIAYDRRRRAEVQGAS